MANATSEVVVEKEPVYVDESLIWTGEGAAEEAAVTEEEVVVSMQPLTAPLTEVKRLCLNIETTGIDPKESRIIAIGFIDPEKAESGTYIIFDEDEESMLRQFFTYISQNSYKELVGYGVYFDYRFLIIKAMSYMIHCKEFFNLELYDLMQVMQQCKRSYLYNYNKTYTLSEWSEYFFNYPKPFTDLEMLKYYETGEYDKVIEFAVSQVNRILLLYLLFEEVTAYTYAEAEAAVSLSPLPESSSDSASAYSKLTYAEANAEETKIVKCPKCLAELEIPSSSKIPKCEVCGTQMKLKA